MPLCLLFHMQMRSIINPQTSAFKCYWIHHSFFQTADYHSFHLFIGVPLGPQALGILGIV